MQIGDLPLPKKPFKINDPYLQKVIEGESCLDSTESVKMHKPELPVGIQKLKKNTRYMDSSGAPHRAQIVSPWIPLDRRFLFTAMQHVTS